MSFDDNDAPLAIVMGKLPEPGRVKTRLCPPLSPEQASQIHDLFLRHTLVRLVDLLGEAVFCVDPPEALKQARDRYADPAGRLRFHPQSSGNLGDRLIAAAEELGRDRPVLFFGCDSPSLPEGHISSAMHSLRDHDLALGPCDDGGFWCMGVRPGIDLRPVVAGVEWSSGKELAQVREKAREAGLSVGSAPGWFDVDRAADLTTLWDRTGDDAPGRRLGNGLFSILTESQRRDLLGTRRANRDRL